MQRKKSQAYELSCHEVDARPNPVLAYQLKRSFHLDLPPFDDYSGLDGGGSDLAGYFTLIASTVAPLGWQVSHEAWIAHFSFEKLVMYADLGRPGTDEEVLGHPVLGALVQAHEYESRPLPSELERPDAFDRPDLFPVMDADFFQLRVLAHAGAGNSLTVEGPPGTGKSQTIVNLIAQAVASNKTVLFVSEKRAALDVVHRRLEECGLDQLCLELHSHRAQRKSLVEDLSNALEFACGSAPHGASTTDFRRRSALRERLDEHVRQVHQPRGAAGLTAFWVHGELARLSATPTVEARLPFPAHAVDGQQEEEMREALRAIQATELWDRAPMHPWRDAEPPAPFIVIGTQLEASLRELIDGLENLLRLRDQVEVSLGASLAPTAANDLERVMSVLRVIAGARDLVRPLSQTGIVPDDLSRAARTICARLLELVDGTDLLDAYRVEHVRWWRGLSPGRWRALWRLQRALKRRLRWREALAVLTAAHAYRSALRSIAEPTEETVGPPGDGRARGASIAEECISSVVVWLGTCLLDETSGELPVDTVLRLLRRPDAVTADAHSLLGSLSAARERIGDSLRVLDDLFPHGVDGAKPTAIPFSELLARASVWHQHLDSLDEWRQFKNALKHAQDFDLGVFLEAARTAGLPGTELERAFVKCLRLAWLRETYQEAPALLNFDPHNHERAIREFSELDRRLVNSARRLVLRSAHDRQEPARVAANHLSAR